MIQHVKPPEAEERARQKSVHVRLPLQGLNAQA